MHFLHTVLYTFPMVLTKRISLTIKSVFSWWSFLLFSRPQCLFTGWYWKGKMVNNHSWGLKIISANKCLNISTPFPLIDTLLKTVLKVMWDSIGLTLFFHVICPKKLPHPLSQSDSKLEPTATWSLALSYTSNSLLCLYFDIWWTPCDLLLCSDWLF